MSRPVRRIPPLALALAGVLLLAGACAPREPERPAVDPQRRSQALIDSGNAAFRAKDFDGAARRYASAAAVKPDDPAAYYGLGMALARLGRDDEARIAYGRARALAGRPADSAGPAHH
jgi:Flp pilus assembly protein TadD